MHRRMPIASEKSRPMREVLLGPFSRRLAMVVMVGALLMPPTGIGLDLCWFHSNTGLPCPGCGITRSLASMAHLDLARAEALHPFGPPLFVVFLLIALSGLLGARGRAPVEAWLDRHDRLVRLLYRGAVLAFVAFGLIRLGVAISHPEALTATLLSPQPTGVSPWP